MFWHPGAELYLCCQAITIVYVHAGDETVCPCEGNMYLCLAATPISGNPASVLSAAAALASVVGAMLAAANTVRVVSYLICNSQLSLSEK